jgi:hypothetical protein
MNDEYIKPTLYSLDQGEGPGPQETMGAVLVLAGVYTVVVGVTVLAVSGIVVSNAGGTYNVMTWA